MENRILEITEAMYKILDFLPDQDPLKIKMKEKVLVILENFTSNIQSEDWISPKNWQISSDIDILLTYLRLARQRGWVSHLNYLIIFQEYNKLKRNIKLPQSVTEKILKIGEGLNKKPKLLAFHQKLAKISPRQQKILEIINRMQKVQVANLIKEIPNITKRTIRRDLDDLLKKGKIIRLGAWNQVFYQIAHH